MGDLVYPPQQQQQQKPQQTPHQYQVGKKTGVVPPAPQSPMGGPGAQPAFGGPAKGGLGAGIQSAGPGQGPPPAMPGQQAQAGPVGRAFGWLGEKLAAPIMHGGAVIGNQFGLVGDNTVEHLRQQDPISQGIAGTVGALANEVSSTAGFGNPYDPKKMWDFGGGLTQQGGVSAAPSPAGNEGFRLPNAVNALAQHGSADELNRMYAKLGIGGNSAPLPKDSPALQFQARQAEASNAAAAPHAGGDATAVLHPDQAPGSPGGQTAPNPQPGSPRSGAGDAFMSDLRSNAMNSGDPGDMQSLTDYMHALSGGVTANAHMESAKAQGIGQYRDPGGLAMFGAANQLSPEQIGGIGQALGHPAPGGAANKGYYESQDPRLRQQPGVDPRTADQTMKLILQGARDPRLLLDKALSQHPQDEYLATTQPSMWNRIQSFMGFNGGMQEADDNLRNYNSIFGR